jgi:hypothetical protein
MNKLIQMPSDSVAQRLKSESMAEQDLSKDLLTELNLLKSRDNYIKDIIFSPFQVILGLKVDDLVLISKHFKQTGDAVGYFDATGTVVQKPGAGFGQKKVLYYSLVCQLPGAFQNDTTLLVETAGMISNSHKTESIATLLSRFKTLVLLHDMGWPFFKDVVTDKSFANLHALSIGFNGMTLSEYLDECYEVFIYDQAISASLVKIHLCTVHVEKNYVNTVATYFPDKVIRENLRHLFRSFLRISSYKSYKKYLKMYITLLINPRLTVDVIKVIDSLQELIRGKKSIEEGLEALEDLEDLEDEEDEEDLVKKSLKLPTIFDPNSLYARSKFYHEAYQMYSEQAKNVVNDKDLPENPYCNTEFILEIFFKSYITFTPLWINVDQKRVFTNNIVESYFKDTKQRLNADNNIGTVPVKICRFIQKMFERNTTIKMDQFREKIPTKKTNHFSGEDDMHIANQHKHSEKWSKRSKIAKTPRRKVVLLPKNSAPGTLKF